VGYGFWIKQTKYRELEEKRDIGGLIKALEYKKYWDGKDTYWAIQAC
jgi:hypothetical protein